MASGGGSEKQRAARDPRVCRGPINLGARCTQRDTDGDADTRTVVLADLGRRCGSENVRCSPRPGWTHQLSTLLALARR